MHWDFIFIITKSVVFSFVWAAIYHKMLNHMNPKRTVCSIFVLCLCNSPFSAIRPMKTWSFSLFLFMLRITWLLFQIICESYFSHIGIRYQWKVLHNVELILVEQGMIWLIIHWGKMTGEIGLTFTIFRNPFFVLTIDKPRKKVAIIKS